MLCLAARLRDGVLAERAIETLLGPLSSRSLLDLHPLEGWPGGAVFQIDGNLGAVAGIAELLVQSHHEVVTILSALPAGWPSGNARGLRVRGGDAVDLEWRDGVLSSVVLHALATREVTIDVPGDGQVRIRRRVSVQAGETVTIGGAVGVGVPDRVTGHQTFAPSGPLDAFAKRHFIDNMTAPRGVAGRLASSERLLG